MSNLHYKRRCGQVCTYPHEDLPWGTVSAEIMQPSKRLFWYAYGWPCGQGQEYGDQIYQDKSWGRFVPFGFNASDGENEKITVPATLEGEITPAGLQRQGGLKPALVRPAHGA